MKRLLYLMLFGSALFAHRLVAQSPEVLATKAKAYQLYEQKQFEQSAEHFQRYLSEVPNDFTAATDYANLLSQLSRHADAAAVLESIHLRQPQNEAAYFRLGVVYINLKRLDEAEKVFVPLEKSSNRDMAAAARDALTRLRGDRAREERMKAEENVYALARDFKYEDVIREVEKLERQGELSWSMEMQRVYAMVSLQQYTKALELAEKLDKRNPGAPDLSLVRADLYNQLGRRAEAEAVWRKIERDHAGSAAASEAKRRLTEKGLAAGPEERVYALARQKKHREVVEAIDELERERPLSPAMELQRLYAWQSLSETKLALKHFEKIAQRHPDKPELALLHADLLIRQHRWEEAASILKRLKEEHAKTPLATQAQNRLAAIPEIANLDKWYWGEAYLSGDYYGRYGTVIGSGFARHGYYMPEVRWLQPYAEMRFSVDTRSGAGPRSTIITDNHIGFYGGMRAQLLPTEYLFVYGQGGVNKDFLDRRDDGDWMLDYQAGIYGFKSWGPGTVLHTPTAEVVQTGSQVPAAQVSAEAARGSEPPKTGDFLWRGEWFVDAGADFSYYHRYASWIGYGQAHEGLRLWQFGASAAVDAYVVENVAWDIRGNYFDNLFEIGPGVRFLWVPRKRWEVVLRTEWLHGFYFGRNELGNRGDTSSTYDNVHLGLSVGIRW